MAEVVVILLTVAFGLLVIYIVSVLSRKPRKVISHGELLNSRQKYFAGQSSKQKEGPAIISQENVESDDLKVITSKNETNESNKHCSAVVSSFFSFKYVNNAFNFLTLPTSFMHC